MIKHLILVTMMATLSLSAKAQSQIVRIADIEVYPQYLDGFIKAGKDIAETSIREETGVICLFPCQLKEEKIRFRIVEVYASPEDYQHHIHTKHFLHYKEVTKKMVKSLKLNELNPMDTDDMTNIFKRMIN